MKLSKYKDDYHEFSGKASNAARQLAFAGIAVIWIFKIGDNHRPQIPEPLLLPLILLVFTLAFDFLQYVVSSFIWGYFFRREEKKLSNISQDPVVSAPYYYNWPGKTFYRLKLFTVLLAYGFLIKFFWMLLFASTGSTLGD